MKIIVSLALFLCLCSSVSAYEVKVTETKAYEINNSGNPTTSTTNVITYEVDKDNQTVTEISMNGGILSEPSQYKIVQSSSDELIAVRNWLQGEAFMKIGSGGDYYHLQVIEALGARFTQISFGRLEQNAKTFER